MRKFSMGWVLVLAAIAFALAGCSDDSSNSASAEDNELVASSSGKVKTSSSSKKGNSDSLGEVGFSSSLKEDVSDSLEMEVGSSSSEAKEISSSSSFDGTRFDRILVSPIRLENLSIDEVCGEENYARIHGNVWTDAWDSSYADQKEPFLTGMLLNLAQVDENGNLYVPSESVKLTYNNLEFPQTSVDYDDMDVRIWSSERDSGVYRLYLYVFATNDTLGSEWFKDDKFVSIDSIDFVRSGEFCAVDPAPVSSSASDPELVKKGASVTTQKGMGFSFDKGQMVTESDADVVFEVDEEEGVITLVGVNGFKVAAYTNDQDKNYDDDWFFLVLPPEPAHLSDFRFTTESLESKIRYFANDVFFVAIGPNYDAETGENFYALTLKTKDGYDGDALKLIIIYYEKK